MIAQAKMQNVNFLDFITQDRSVASAKVLAAWHDGQLKLPGCISFTRVMEAKIGLSGLHGLRRPM